MSMGPKQKHDPTFGGILEPLCGGMGQELPRGATQENAAFSVADLVAALHEWMGQGYGETTHAPALRIRLHQQEHTELIEALEAAPDDARIEYLTNVARELADNIIVAYGSAYSMGIPLDLVISVVIASLHTRLNSDGGPNLDSEGKLSKGTNYEDPHPTIRQVIKLALIRRGYSG